MMPRNDFSGVWTAIATPFLPDERIDWKAFDALLDAQQAGGIRGIVVAGTTGEGPTLSNEEKLELVSRTRKRLAPTVRVMAGTGGNNTAQTIELSLKAQDCGADSLLIVTPPYNKPSPAGLQVHYRRIAESVRIPLCLYHVPGRTGQLLSADAIAAVCAIPGVSVVKEASGDVGLFSRALQKAKVPFLTGDDGTFLPSLAVGGSGVISVVSNVFPRETVAIQNAFDQDRADLARQYHEAMFSFIDALFCEANPGPLKAALALAGLIGNVLRAPLAPVTAESHLRLETTMREARRRLEEVKAHAS
jgi:4-hydroxy-tetrahydrodipicolinate synthase